MNESMIKKVARAIGAKASSLANEWEVVEENGFIGLVDDYSNSAVDLCEIARAAIDAMHEPTDMMVS